jgi:hypothetical protein
MITQGELIKRLMECILAAHQDDCECIDCEQCSHQLDNLAELSASGIESNLMLPSVKAHLCDCADCREEFEALVAIIRAEHEGDWEALNDV